MKNIRRNSITGIIESQGLTEVSLHFSEWWNGEGMDFTIDDKKTISLHSEELHAIILAGLAAEMVDFDLLMDELYDLLKESEKRERMIENMRSKHNV